MVASNASSPKALRHLVVRERAAASGAAAAAVGKATAGRSGVCSRRRVADGRAFGKPAARGGLGGRDGPTTGGDGGFGGETYIGGPARVSDKTVGWLLRPAVMAGLEARPTSVDGVNLSDETVGWLSSSCDREAGSGDAGGAGVDGFGGGMWTGTTTQGAGGPWTKETTSVMSSAAKARGGERPRPLQTRKGSPCQENALAATPAKGTSDQSSEMHLESDDESPPAAGSAVMLGEPITDSKVLKAVSMHLTNKQMPQHLGGRCVRGDYRRARRPQRSASYPRSRVWEDDGGAFGKPAAKGGLGGRDGPTTGGDGGFGGETYIGGPARVSDKTVGWLSSSCDREAGCRNTLAEDAFEATIAEHVDRNGVRAIQDLVTGIGRKHIREDDGGAFGKPAAKGGLGGRDGPTTGGDGGFGGETYIGGPARVSDKTVGWLSSSCDREAGCRKPVGEDAFGATIAEHVDRNGVRAIHDLASGNARKHNRPAASGAAAPAVGKATADRSGVRSRRRVADGRAFGKPAARGGVGGRDGPTTGGDGGFGGETYTGGPASLSDHTLPWLSSSCDREAGSGGDGGAGGAGVDGFGGGMWTGTTMQGAGGPWTKEIASVMSSAAQARKGERSRPLQPRKNSSGEKKQQQQEEGFMKVSSVGASGEKGSRCWENALTATPAQGTSDQCPEIHLEKHDEGPPAAGSAVMLGEPITDSKVLKAVRMHLTNKVADGRAFGKPAARGGLGGRDGPTTGVDGGFGGETYTGGPASLSNHTLPWLSSSCDREAGSGGAGGAGGTGVDGFGDGMWTGTTTQGAGGPWTKEITSVIGEKQQQQQEEGDAKVSSVGASGEEGARCWENAVAATPAKGTPDQCLEVHLEKDDERPPAAGVAVMLGEPITDSKVLMAVRMPVTNKQIPQGLGGRCVRGDYCRARRPQRSASYPGSRVRVADGGAFGKPAARGGLGGRDRPTTGRDGGFGGETYIGGPARVSDKTVGWLSSSCDREAGSGGAGGAGGAGVDGFGPASNPPSPSVVGPSRPPTPPHAAGLPKAPPSATLRRERTPDPPAAAVPTAAAAAAAAAALLCFRALPDTSSWIARTPLRSTCSAKVASNASSPTALRHLVVRERCRNTLAEDAFEATIAEHVDRNGVRAIHDLVSGIARKHNRPGAEAAAAAAAVGKATAGRSGVRSRRREDEGEGV
ncbi:unnamed protein product [Ectocarpus sp. CCAP 1310/34]|nr:unnamed protein product [Ectocarpus sp. CCAP 1310/34]